MHSVKTWHAYTNFLFKTTKEGPQKKASWILPFKTPQKLALESASWSACLQPWPCFSWIIYVSYKTVAVLSSIHSVFIPMTVSILIRLDFFYLSLLVKSMLIDRHSLIFGSSLFYNYHILYYNYFYMQCESWWVLPTRIFIILSFFKSMEFLIWKLSPDRCIRTWWQWIAHTRSH